MTVYLLAILLTLFIGFVIPIYWKNYGPENFLWLSDVGLFITLPALWLQSPLLMSMAMIGIFPLELIWTIDYFYCLFTGKKWLGITTYMFDPTYSRFLRGLSLFHIVIPVIWIVYLIQWGYDTDAPIYQTVLTWGVLFLTYFSTRPSSNINWVFLPKVREYRKIPGFLWLLLLLLAFPLIIIWPMHCLMVLLFK
jgi:hypothetical protein